MTPPVTPPSSPLAPETKGSAPVIRFDPSQRQLFADQARVIAVNWHRQKGKDFTAAAKAFDSALQTGQSWYIVGMTQAQADETFAKVRKVSDAHKALLKRRFGKEEALEESESFIDWDREIDHAFECTARILRLPNGGRIVSLPGRDPDSLAGRTGNLILTEFGLYPKGGYPHWDVLFPITTRGGYRLIAISTPRGKNTKFYELCSNAEGFYSVHTCDIYHSVFHDGYQLYDAKGNPFPQSTRAEQELAIATFRRIYNSESKWAREYECQFTGDLSSLVSWADLERAGELGRGRPFDLVELKGGSRPMGDLLHAIRTEAAGGAGVAVGWDVARHGDVSAITVNFSKPNQPRHLRFVVAMQDLQYRDQRELVSACMDLRSDSVGYGDATGLGDESNEELQRHYRERWTPFTFTAPGKREIASSLATGFRDGTQTLPPMDGPHKFIATDVYAIQKDDSGGSLLLEETANPLYPSSHCDFAYSLGLNRLAGSRNLRPSLPPPLASKDLLGLGAAGGGW